jgi:hypothetical protein
MYETYGTRFGTYTLPRFFTSSPLCERGLDVKERGRVYVPISRPSSFMHRTSFSVYLNELEWLQRVVAPQRALIGWRSLRGNV